MRVLERDELMLPSDHICTLVAEDATGAILASVSAISRAEVHLTVAPVSTPAARLELVQQLHRRMERELYHRGLRRAWTFEDDTCLRRFFQRLRTLGWRRSHATAYYRELRG